MKIRHMINIVILVMLASCGKEEKYRMRTSYVEFTTDVNITAYNLTVADTARVNAVLSSSRNIFEYFNSEMNPYLETSSLYKLNHLESGKNHVVPAPLSEILKISRNIYRYSGHAFDVAVLPLVELWGFDSSSSPSAPDKKTLGDFLNFSNLESFEFTDDSVKTTDPRCMIGLGGIAKGYAIDSVGAYLISEGVKDFIVEAGGDLIIRSDQKKSVGIRHPRKENELIDTIYVSNGAVATSGDYEKFIINNGTRFCHIINPATGLGTSDCISVTVISRKAYLSDAFATAAFVLGREKGRYFIEKNNMSGMIFYEDEKGLIRSEKINLEQYEKNETY